MRDIRYVLRVLRRSPASAIAAVLTLALTLGATVSIFAVVDAVLLTPPPFVNADALAVIGETAAEAPAAARRAVTYGTFEAWRERARALARLEAFDNTNLTLTKLGAAERLSVNDVTPGFLNLLGVTPVLGRRFDLSDVGSNVAIISHAFWRSRLAATPDVVGHGIVLGGVAHTIVGVLPEQFSFGLNESDVWRLLPVRTADATRIGYRVTVVARLAPNVPLTTLGTALDDVSGRSSPPAHVVVTGMAAAIAGDAPRTLGVLAGSAGLATLLAFANLTGLLMVRSIDRRRELAVRTALGARRSEIARQLVLEAEMLAGMGIIGGVLVALWTTPAIGRLGLAQFGGVANGDVPASWRAIVVIAVLGVVCAAISGSLPALMAARHDVVDALRRGSTLAPREVRLRRVLVGAEVAIAFLLLVCVTFLGTSLVRALTQNPGFDADGVLTLQVSVPASRYPTSERVAAFYADLQRAIDERLGAGRAAIINEIPLTGDGGRGPVRAQPTDVGMEAVVREAGASYFDVMRIPVVAGRAFDARSSAAGQPVVVVSESLAQRLFGVVSPIGRHIIAAGEDSEIIGIVGDVKHRALDAELSPTVYISALRSPSRSRIVVARSTRPDADVVAAVREAVARLDGDLPVYRVRTMRDVIDTSPGVPTRRVLAAAFAGFAVLAIILGGIGLFGLVAHDVARRRTEIALRVALGAGPMRILATAVAQGSVVVACGLAVGGILSFWAIGALRTVLASADHLDMWGIGAAATLVIMAAACAVLPPALQAIRIDPIIALRAE